MSGTYQLLPPLRAEEFERLKRSIMERGVEVPVVYDEEGNLLDGHHRVLIADSLSIDYPRTVRAGLAPHEKRLLAVDLNIARRQLVDGQIGLLGERIEPDIAERARHRMLATLKRGGEPPAQESFPERGQTRDEVAAAVGFGCGKTYEAAKRVISAVREEVPELLPELEAGAKTLRDARRELNDRRRERALDEMHEEPADEGPPGPPYRVILADPPWQYAQQSARLNGTTERHYRTLAARDIAALPVVDVAADDAILLLWTTWPFLPAALEIVDAWGFTYVTGLPWVKADAIGTDFDGTVRFKPNKGVGFWFRGATEPLILAKRGKPSRARAPCDGILSDRNIHSRKPTLVHDIAEGFGAPRLELFARERRAGWAAVGDGIDGNDIGATLHELAATARPGAL